MDQQSVGAGEETSLLAYERIDATRVLFPARRESTSMPASYSDGESAELNLLKIIETATDRSSLSPELEGRICDWVTTYHLSPARANLLRPFEALIGESSVLEVGAGCGALTRYLGETARSVTALEPSPIRARIAAARCRELSAVKVVCHDLLHCQFDEPFDLVTLVGVLEYATMSESSGAEAAAVRWLRRAFDLMRPGGKLLVAIENQLGLKYFSGAPEDHLGQPMLGISNQYRKGQPRTYGRAAIERMLRDAGFSSIELYAPLPDYKLPRSVLALPDEARDPIVSLNVSLLRQAVRHDRQQPVPGLFPLGATWERIARNGLAGHLANSFLYLATKPDSEISFDVEPPRQIAAWHYSLDRMPELCKEARFEIAGEGLKVSRRPLSPPKASSPRKFSMHLSDEAYQTGIHWGDRLEEILLAPGWSASNVVSWLQIWLDALHREIGIDGSDLDSRVPGDCIDFLPHNLVVQHNGRTIFIDKEWSFKGLLDLRYVVFRALFVVLMRVTAVAKPAHGEHLRILSLIKAIFTGLGSTISNSELEHFLAFESRFQTEVTGRSVSLSLRDIEQAHLPELPSSLAIVKSASYQLSRVNELEALITAQREALKQRDAELACMASHNAQKEAAERARLQARMEELQKTHSAEVETLRRENETLAQQQRSLEAARQEMQRSETTIATLQDALRQHQRELTRARQELQRGQAEETVLRSTLQTSERELAAVREELGIILAAEKELHGKLATLESENKTIGEACVSLRQQVMDLSSAAAAAEQIRSEVASLRSELEQQRREREALEASNARAEDAARILRRQVMELTAAVQHHKINSEALLASTSWRLTAPLRKVVDWCRRLI